MIRSISVTDDGKGRTFQRPFPLRRQVVDLVLKDWQEISKAGEYAFTDQIGTWGVEVIILSCPWCNNETTLPVILKVLTKEPLTIESEIHCRRCDTSFHIIGGKAIETWAGEIPWT